jgi:nicotinamidase-related amidase
VPTFDLNPPTTVLIDLQQGIVAGRTVPHAAPDVVVTKHQPNAFYGTDLEIQLRRRGIRTMVLGGIATNLGVDSTARRAHERGYEQVFVEDAMAAREEDLHAYPVTGIFPTMGRVRSTDDVLGAPV